MTDELQKLFEQAESWSGVDSLITDHGTPVMEYYDWADQVKEALRSMPNAYEVTKKFLRLQRFHNYNWYEDIAGDEDREKLSHKIITESIDYIKRLLNKNSSEDTKQNL